MREQLVDALQMLHTVSKGCEQLLDAHRRLLRIARSGRIVVGTRLQASPSASRADGAPPGSPACDCQPQRVLPLQAEPRDAPQPPKMPWATAALSLTMYQQLAARGAAGRPGDVGLRLTSAAVCMTTDSICPRCDSGAVTVNPTHPVGKPFVSMVARDARADTARTGREQACEEEQEARRVAKVLRQFIRAAPITQPDAPSHEQFERELESILTWTDAKLEAFGRAVADSQARTTAVLLAHLHRPQSVPLTRSPRSPAHPLPQQPVSK